uniref:Leo1-like protein n=1 Tax=Arcella intermedia TaxID=1963864 RepID=A0A6B2L6X5_9EUKA
MDDTRSEEEEKPEEEEKKQDFALPKFNSTFDEGEEPEPQDEQELILQAMPFDQPPRDATLHFFKLAGLAIEPRPFDKATFAVEEEELQEDSLKKLKKKIAPTTIRWRYALDSNKDLFRQSNARFVRWSDGSVHLFVGKEAFGVNIQDFKDYHDLFLRQRVSGSGESFLQSHGTLEKKIIVNPIDNVDRLKKEALLKMNSAKALENKRERPHFIASTSDPEKEKKQKELIEANRYELKRKFGRENSTQDLTNDYLEQGAGDEYDEEKEKESEARIMAAKRGQRDEEEEDEDFFENNSAEEEEEEPEKKKPRN